MITAETKIITPEWAAEILQTKNHKNRHLRGWWAEALAAAMRRGEWITTHQGIAFDEDGNVIDGQHKLKAVVLSKMSIEMMVFHGVPKAAFSVLDIGAKRNYADTTGLSKKTAEACRRAVHVAFGAATVTPQMVSKVADAGLADVHERLIAYAPKAIAVYSSAPIRLAACILVMDGHPEEYIFRMYKNLVSQNMRELPEIALSLVRQVNGKKISTVGVHSDSLLARAIKMFRPENADIQKLMLSEGDVTGSNAYVRYIIRRALNSVDQ